MKRTWLVYASVVGCAYFLGAVASPGQFNLGQTLKTAAQGAVSGAVQSVTGAVSGVSQSVTGEVSRVEQSIATVGQTTPAAATTTTAEQPAAGAAE